MFRRAGQLLARIRGARPVAAAVVAPRRWADELRAAGVDAGEWIATRRSAARLYVDLPDRSVERLRERYPDLVRATVVAADRVLRHEFDLLGSGPYSPVDPDRTVDATGYRPIDWHFDPVCRLRFPRGIPISAWDLDRMRPGLADIKFPWELSRCQHWPLLGQAYRLTRDDRFAVEIARELRDFMEANPIGTAVNWACTMDVALRAANWAIGLDLIRSCPALPDSFWHEAHEALFDHGTFIEGHLENNYEVTSNHFLSNVVGLFYLAAVFRDLPRGRSWDRQCRAWLAQEMDVQVLPDGADYESSIPYHRLVTELLLGAARVAQHGGHPLSETLTTRLRTMVEFLAAVLRPDGLMPQIGDADDGRLHILSAYGSWHPQDPRHLFAPAGGVLGTARWVSLTDGWGEWEAAWWGCETSRLEPGEALDVPAVRQFPHAGLTVVRRDRDYLIITNGVVGTDGFGNHKHNDLLGFEYHRDGEAVIVDPGSYVYTSDPASRDLFRSTGSHNTVVVDDQEQNEIRPGWLFRMFGAATPEHLYAGEQDDALEYRGRHTGYTRLPEPVIHERLFRLSKTTGALSILDVLEGRGTHGLRWHFHFAPGVAVAIDAAGEVRVRKGDTLLVFTVPLALQATVAPGWYSPSYGVRIPCVTLDLNGIEPINGRREYRFHLVSRPLVAGEPHRSAGAAFST